MAVPQLAGFAANLRIGTDITSVGRHMQQLERVIKQTITSGDSTNFSCQRAPVNRFFGFVYSRWEWPLVRILSGGVARAATREGHESAEFQDRLSQFAHWHAGRWAAKEATIKALYPRKILMPSISILPPRIVDLICEAGAQGHTFRPSDAQMLMLDANDAMSSGKPLILVHPVAPSVRFGIGVAQKRGLRAGNPGKTPTRLFRSTLAECQLVDGSISHDHGVNKEGGWAMATVLASSELTSTPNSNKVIVDDGYSVMPIHEPVIGDEGFQAWGIKQPEGD